MIAGILDDGSLKVGSSSVSATQMVGVQIDRYTSALVYRSIWTPTICVALTLLEPTFRLPSSRMPAITSRSSFWPANSSVKRVSVSRSGTNWKAP